MLLPFKSNSGCAGPDNKLTELFASFYAGGEPKHRCRLPANVSQNDSIPYQYVDGERHYDSCVVYEDYSSSTNRTVPCPLGWEYDHDSFTINEQVTVVGARPLVQVR